MRLKHKVVVSFGHRKHSLSKSNVKQTGRLSSYQNDNATEAQKRFYTIIVHNYRTNHKYVAYSD